MAQSGKTFEKDIVVKITLNYLLYLPSEYETQPDKKWPLVLFLHGAGERGNDLELVKRYAIPHLAEKRDFPFIAVSPQCPEDSLWEMEFDALNMLLAEIEEKYSVDPDRIYLTGLSMGGYGAWDFAMSQPERFAAVVPVAGGTSYPELAGILKDVPMWVFHGALDTAVPVEESDKPVAVLEKCGGNIKYTRYSDKGHDVCGYAYEVEALYEWLLGQRRRSAAKVQE